MSKLHRLTIPAFLALALAFGSARADVVTVLATDNIFGAGHTIAPNPGGGSGGTLPPSIAALGGQIFSVSQISGTVSLTPGHPSNGDGSPDFTTNITSFNGISGIIDTARSGFLVGVFLTASVPADPAPSRLTFNSPENFTSLSPLLNQTFLIGDGRNDQDNTIQQFVAPTGATRLFLGFADANGYVGAPGQYQDNSGSLTLTIGPASVPEPSVAMLLVTGGLALLAPMVRRATKPL
jgi:hypothetical protein